MTCPHCEEEISGLKQKVRVRDERLQELEEKLKQFEWRKVNYPIPNCDALAI